MKATFYWYAKTPEVRTYTTVSSDFPPRAVVLAIGRGRLGIGLVVTRYDGRKMRAWWRPTRRGAVELFEAQHDLLVAARMARWS